MTLQEELKLRETLEGRGDPLTFDTSYIVEAGAGAGKSTTMVRRITNLLLSGKCLPEQLVAITFTVKATQELKNKLEENFRKLLAEHPDDGRYRELADSVDLMQISTIDSFCRKLLTTMPFSNPFGMSGVMETDDKQRGKAYFRRRCRSDDEISKLCDRFGLSYDTLEQVFLDSCGGGDYRPAYTPTDASEIREIEDKLLPDAAKSIRTQVRNILETYPLFKDVVDSELLALAELPETDYCAGGSGTEGLARYLRTHTKLHAEYGGMLDEAQRKFVKGKVDTFWKGFKTLLPKVYSKCRLTAEDGNKYRKQIEAYLDTDAAYRKIVAPELNELLAEFNDDTFVSDPPSLERFNDFIHKRQTTAGPLRKKWIAPSTNITDFRAALETALGLGSNDASGIVALSARLAHSYAMTAVDKLLADYEKEKRASGVATFIDVLRMARDMLRDSAEARAYCQNRYRYFYVDEFQDTDATQTELLFYLATPEPDFHAGDWKKCRPRPGSLFLVGDPKQAIYRFRGADIDTYSAVWKRFAEDKIGEAVYLSFNFRSTKEICDLSRNVFERLLDGKDCQARYADMTAVLPDAAGNAQERAADPLSLALCYQAEEGDDPERVAAFVEETVRRGVSISTRDGVRSVRYEDFLILTYRKKSVNAYAAALRARNIPVNVTGEQLFSDTESIARAVVLLRYLLDREDTLNLIRLLQTCYGASLTAMRRLTQRGGLYSLTQLFQTEERDGTRQRKLDGVAKALCLETPRDEELLALCGALAEIGDFAALIGVLPAMSVLEHMFATLGCLWPKTGEQRARREDRARVEQFLERLRAEKMKNFAALAERAITLADEGVETELMLEAERGCVRVMNLHKAKGLEGEIVVLANHKGKLGMEPASHREQMEDGARRLHLCLYKKYMFNQKPVAWDEGWSEEQAREKRYQDAERIRLLYVAATRAKSMLIVNQCELWKPICDAIGGAKKGKEMLAEMAKGAGTDAERDRVDALLALYAPSAFPREKLNVQRTPLRQAAPPPAMPVQVSPQQMETALHGHVAALAESDCYAITPSRLDHGSRASRLKKDRVDEEDAALEQTAEESVPDAQSSVAERSSGPHGPDWGTIIHRVMELAVRDGRFAPEDIAAFARQAVSETLGDAPLTKTQRRMLGGEAETSDKDLLSSVAAAAAEAAGFVTREDAPLRKLISCAECYPELPFQLYAEDRESEAYRHLARHISDEQARDKTLEVQGVIDLAIRKNGVWTIVDYKTDILRGGEGAEQFRERLRDEYTPQITAYAKVMEQFSGERVDGLYLCSIPLGGELIELAAGTAAQPPARSDGAPERHKASDLLTRYGFSSLVKSCAGAKSFALWREGEPVTLKGKDGASHPSLPSCRIFSDGIADWVETQWPDADTWVDTTGVGSVQIMRRTLRMLRRALPRDEWNKLELSWEQKETGK